MRPELYEILGDYEHCETLEEYKQLYENHNLDRAYFDNIIKNNDSVAEHFKKLGEGGVKYLKQTLNHNHLSIREKSSHILYYIAKHNRKYSRQILNILKERKKIENEESVLERIVYNLEKIEKL